MRVSPPRSDRGTVVNILGPSPSSPLAPAPQANTLFPSFVARMVNSHPAVMKPHWVDSGEWSVISSGGGGLGRRQNAPRE